MKYSPAADRLRPASFDEMAGQERLVGKNGILRKMAESGKLSSVIFFGPPGTGKTTAATILAESSGKELYKLNATTASLSDVREVAAAANSIAGSAGVLLYLDEIQYFNKKQQQSLLQYIEDGSITLIASTTENPYYYIYDALLSRCAVFEFKKVVPSEIEKRLIAVAEKMGQSGRFTPVEGVEIPEGYVESVSAKVKNKCVYSRTVQFKNYFNVISDLLKTAAPAETTEPAVTTAPTEPAVTTAPTEPAATTAPTETMGTTAPTEPTAATE